MNRATPITLFGSSRLLLGDTVTPIAAYLKLRDIFPNVLLLESGDYRGPEKSRSFICCHALALFTLDRGNVAVRLPDGTTEAYCGVTGRAAIERLGEFLNSVLFSHETAGINPPAGVFGYTSYQAVQYFENISFQTPVDPAIAIPEMVYGIYEFVLSFNHFRGELVLTQWRTGTEEKRSTVGVGLPATLDELINIIDKRPWSRRQFRVTGGEFSNFTDEEYKGVIHRTIGHIQRGDVFQIVPSRRFSTPYDGDDFLVYRALRSINPSPYLFYFDYGYFRLFGSSPEAQLVVSGCKATLLPIAGTVRRSGDDLSDTELAKKLRSDPKQQSEHVMLVDLARNDLSRHAEAVSVESLMEVQFYSHVIHLVSKVTGRLLPGAETLDVFADTFPAGTLSGAPKYRAMEILDSVERGGRTFYGGALGFFGADGSCNHCIVIRSFLSASGVLHRQAGGGVVALSSVEDEAEEANNKLLALRAAIELAQSLN